MNELGTVRHVTARKEHRCDLCDWTIPKGDIYYTWSLPPQWGDNDTWFTGHTHVICDKIYRASEWFDPHEPMPPFGEFRSELLGYVTEATASVVRFDGDERHRARVLDAIAGWRERLAT